MKVNGYLLDSGTGNRLAKAGFAVYGMDYLGHGKSSGLQGYISNFDELVNDCSDYFTSICGKEDFVLSPFYFLLWVFFFVGLLNVPPTHFRKKGEQEEAEISPWGVHGRSCGSFSA